MNDVLTVFLLSLLGSVVALIGGVTFLFSRRLSDKLARYSIPFAAGVLLTISLTALLPEAVHFTGEKAFTVVLISFLGAYLFEHLVCRIHHHESFSESEHLTSSIPLVIIGDTIHNFIDGVAIAASYLINPGLGLITAISTFLHEVPHEISDFGILLKAGWERKRVLLINILSASVTVPGAFLVLLFSQNDALIGTLLSVSAGLFLYLGASDFLPHIDKEHSHSFRAILPLLAGVLIMLGALLLIPHKHKQQHTEPADSGQVGQTERNPARLKV